MSGCIPVAPRRSYVCVAGMPSLQSGARWPTNLHMCYNGLHVYGLNCVIKFLLQYTDAFNNTVAYIFNLRYFCCFSVTTAVDYCEQRSVSFSKYVRCVSG